MNINKKILFLIRLIRNPRDIFSICQYIFFDKKITYRERINVIINFLNISYYVDCPHKQHEILEFIKEVSRVPKDTKGVIIEAGCYKGGSSSKFSIVSKYLDRDFIIFDSFEGMPENNEPHEKNIFGGSASFPKGKYCGKYDEVKENINQYGEIEKCTLIKGWFSETLPQFNEPIIAAYIDVDLVSSTKECLKYIFPLLQPNSVLISQDGHLPLVLEVFNDKKFWENELGIKRPRIEKIGRGKLIKVTKA